MPSAVKVAAVLELKFMVGVAQLVELRVVIPVVAGSSPVAHPKFRHLLAPSVRAWLDVTYARLLGKRPH